MEEGTCRFNVPNIDLPGGNGTSNFQNDNCPLVRVYATEWITTFDLSPSPYSVGRRL